MATNSMPTVLEKVRKDHPTLEDYRKEQAALDRKKETLIAQQLDIIAKANEVLAELGYKQTIAEKTRTRRTPDQIAKDSDKTAKQARAAADAETDSKKKSRLETKATNLEREAEEYRAKAEKHKAKVAKVANVAGK